MKKSSGLIKWLHFMRNNSVVMDTTHGLIHYPNLTMPVKSAWSEKTAEHQLVLTDDALTIPPRTTKAITAFCRPFFRKEHNRYCDTIEQVCGNRKSADFPLNVNKRWQKSSRQSNQYNGITISSQKEHTDCRNLPSHSGAIQVYQTSRYGNPQYNSGRWSRFDCLPKRVFQNEQTPAAKQHYLAPDT